MKSRIFFKLVAVFLFVIAATALLLDLSMRRVWQDSLKNEIEQSLTEKTRVFAYHVEQRGSSDLRQLTINEARLAGTRATVIDTTGKVLADSQADPDTMENHAGRPEFREILGGKNLGMSQRHSATVGVDYLYVATPIKGGAVRMAYPLALVTATLASAQSNFIYATIVVILAVMVIAAYIAHSFGRRVARIVEFADRIAAGDLSARIAPTARDEITEVAMVLDRTARQLEQSFQQVENGRQELETLLNSMQEAVVAVSKDRRVLWANGPMNRAVPGGVRIAAPLVESIRVPEVMSVIQQTIDDSEVRRGRAELPGQGRRFEITAAPMPGGGAVAVLHEITEIERIEKSRRDFVANVSHELRTPLTSVQGYVETLIEMDGNADRETTKEFLDIIRKNTSRMTRLTEDLLILARVESGEDHLHLENVMPRALLLDAAKSFTEIAKMRGQSLEVENKATRSVRADPEKIHQVLTNLIDNALKYSASEGTIELGSRDVDVGVEFYVRDFGSGIPSEHLPRLFERFYRVDKARSRDSGGTGLGLAIAKHIVLKHAGSIYAESELNRGSRFAFTLPLADTSTGPKAA
jgi:two-component system phosphate regulon sensor histidine kinase PhoR